MDDQKIAIRGTLRAIWGRVCWRFSGTMGQFLVSQKGLTSKLGIVKTGYYPLRFVLASYSKSISNWAEGFPLFARRIMS